MTRPTGCAILASFVLFCAVVVQAQTTQPTTAASASELAVEDRLIPAERFDSVPLQDVLDYIRDRVPGFNAVIIREPGVPEDYPTIPRMDFRNVTIGQFMAFIHQAFANVSVKPIAGPHGPLYVVQVRPGPAVIAATQALAPAEPIVRVYRLKEITDALIGQLQSPSTHPADEAVIRQQAISHVLSVFQEALAEAGETQPPALKVHPPTLTLIFRGTESQRLVLEEVLRALQPRQKVELLR